MRVLIDTNILISAALSNKGTPFAAFKKAVTYPNHEMRRIFNRKFPKKIEALEKFLSLALMTLEMVPTPVEEYDSEMRVRDVNDRPILRAALSAKADILLTGDKDFLESGLEKPKIMTAMDFVQFDLL